MDTLRKYNERIYISSILCDLSYNFYSNIFNISLLPTILGSSLLTILNSSEVPSDIMKIINISINGANTLILALMNSYKISDRLNLFKNYKIKFTKLNHLCESIINRSDIDSMPSGELKTTIDNIINEFDKLQEELIYQYPSHIRKKVIKRFGSTHTLPNSLEIENNLNLKSEYVLRTSSSAVHKLNEV